jgi:hypothetical protein
MNTILKRKMKTANCAVFVLPLLIMTFCLTCGNKNGVKPVPGAPTLLSPANGSTIDDNTPTFEWSDVSGAEAYELMVDDSSGFSAPDINEGNLAVSTYTPSDSLTDDTYYWKVRARNSQGTCGDWSAVWSFTISTEFSGYWGTPVFLGDDFESKYHPSISGDGKTLYVSSNNELFYSTLDNGSWSSLTKLPFPGTAPCIEYGGETLYFENEGKIYSTVKTGDQWSEPAYLFEGARPTVIQDGTIIFYCTEGIEYAEFEGDEWIPREGIAAVNALGEVSDPAVSGDGIVLFFNRKRTSCPRDWEECGGYEIFSCRQVNEEWRNPVALGPVINFTFDNYTPCISWDMYTLYFATTTPAWWSDPSLRPGIYVSTWVYDEPMFKAIPPEIH